MLWKNHITKDIKFIDFNKTQEINKSKNKGNSYNNEFFVCLTCKQNVCLLCKQNHNRNHNIIKYDQKNYICPKHNDVYIKYCEDCHTNMCFSCIKEHTQHKTINLSDILPDIEKSKKRLKDIKYEIDILTNPVNRIINKLIKFLEAINMYYEINTIFIRFNPLFIYLKISFNNIDEEITLLNLTFNYMNINQTKIIFFNNYQIPIIYFIN